MVHLVVYSIIHTRQERKSIMNRDEGHANSALPTLFQCHKCCNTGGILPCTLFKQDRESMNMQLINIANSYCIYTIQILALKLVPSFPPPPYIQLFSCILTLLTHTRIQQHLTSDSMLGVATHYLTHTSSLHPLVLPWSHTWLGKDSFYPCILLFLKKLI